MKRAAVVAIVVGVVLVFIVLPSLKRRGSKLASTSVAEVKIEEQNQNSQTTTLKRGEIVPVVNSILSDCRTGVTLGHCPTISVRVMNLNGAGKLRFNDDCEIDYSDSLELMGEDGDRVLVRHIPGKKRNKKFCPRGTLTFIDRNVFVKLLEFKTERLLLEARWKTEQEEQKYQLTKQRTEQERRDREAVKKILAESSR